MIHEVLRDGYLSSSLELDFNYCGVSDRYPTGRYRPDFGLFQAGKSSGNVFMSDEIPERGWYSLILDELVSYAANGG